MEKSKKILVIEDNQALVSTIQQALDDPRYQLLVAGDGQEGYTKALQERPDAIVLDIMLPGESGFSCLERLKQTEATKFIPVLILSNLGQEHEIQQGMDLGAVDYMIKADFSIQEIAGRIKKLVDQARR